MGKKQRILFREHTKSKQDTNAMPALKKLDRSATVGFCPHAGLMAAGTVAGAIDQSFSTSSTLDVRSLTILSYIVKI